MTQRINYIRQSPDVFKKFLEFNNSLTQEGAIEEKTHDLVVIRASQLNGCAFCLDMHVKQAKLHGERELRIYHLPIWRESTLAPSVWWITTRSSTGLTTMNCPKFPAAQNPPGGRSMMSTRRSG